MKRSWFKTLAVLVFALVGVLCVSCGDDDNPLEGTWKRSWYDRGSMYIETYKFGSKWNGTLTTEISGNSQVENFTYAIVDKSDKKWGSVSGTVSINWSNRGQSSEYKFSIYDKDDDENVDKTIISRYITTLTLNGVVYEKSK